MPLLLIQGLNTHITEIIILFNVGVSLYILFTTLVIKKSFVFDHTDILIIIFFLYCALKCCFSSKYVDPSYFLKWSIFLNCYFAFKLFSQRAKKIIWWAFVSIGLVQGVIVILQFFAIVPSRNPFFEVSGTFHNPAPTALCIAGTFLLLLRKTFFYVKIQEKGVMYFLLSLLFVCVFSLIVCGSRTAFFSCAVASLICADKETRAFKNIRYKFALFLTIALIVLCGLFVIRPNSAMSRITVWRISLKDCKSTIIFGKGATSFPSCYQLAQEEYFRENSESIFLPYSDEHFHPFNELVHIVYEDGIIGLFLASLIFISVIKKKNLCSKELLIFVILASFFIYVSELTYIMICLACSMCRETRMGESRKWNRIVLSFVQMIGVFFSVLIVILNSKEYHPEDIFLEREFVKSYIINNTTVNSKLISELEYEGLSADNIQTYVLLTEKNPTYDKYYMLGMYFSKEKMTYEAEQYFLKAMNLIPSRIGAAYELFCLYRQSNPQKASKYAKIIVNRRGIYKKRMNIKEKQLEIDGWLYFNKDNFE